MSMASAHAETSAGVRVSLLRAAVAASWASPAIPVRRPNNLPVHFRSTHQKHWAIPAMACARLIRIEPE